MGLGFSSVWVLTTTNSKPVLFTTQDLVEKHLVNWEKKSQVGPCRYEYIVSGKKFELELTKIRGTGGIL